MKWTYLSLATLALHACSSDEPRPDVFADTDTHGVIAVGSDFDGAGVLTAVGVPSLTVTQGAVGGVLDSDPVSRQIGSQLFFLSRSDSNVTILDASTLELVQQISVLEDVSEPTPFNPQDVAITGNVLYVAGLGVGEIRVFDLDEPEAGYTAIDTSEFDAVDGNPDCNAMHLSGSDLYVACGLLDNFVPQGEGLILVIDTQTNEVAANFNLDHANPFGRFIATNPDSVFGGDLLIPTVPTFQDLSLGCLERVSLDRTHNGCLLENLELSGFVSSMGISPDGDLVASVTTGYDGGSRPNAYVMSYDGTNQRTIVTGSQAFDLAVCPDGGLAVAEAAVGVRVFAPGGTERTMEPLDIGENPVQGGLICYSL